MAKDTALENLWNTTDDTFVYRTLGTPAKMVKKSSNSVIGRRSKVQGYLTYFLPKDKKGKAIGKPQKFLRVQKLGQTTNDFIPFDVVTPYYEDILKNKARWISLGGSDLVQLAQKKLSGVDPNAIASKFSGANGAIDLNGNINTDLGIDFNPLNERKRIVTFITDSYWTPNKYSSVSALETISDPNISVVDADTMNQAYKESGSKNNFNDWMNSEGGKGILNQITLLANTLVNSGNQQQGGLPIGNVPTNKPEEEDDKPKTETKILGMSPVTFGLVAFGVIAVGSIVTIMMIKNKNTKLKVSQ